MPSQNNGFTEIQISQFLSGTASDELKKRMLEDLERNPGTGRVAQALANLSKQSTLLLNADLSLFESDRRASDDEPTDSEAIKEETTTNSSEPLSAAHADGRSFKEWMSFMGALAACSLLCLYVGSMFNRQLNTNEADFAPASATENSNGQSLKEWLVDARSRTLSNSNFMAEFAHDHTNEFRRWYNTLDKEQSGGLRKSAEEYLDKRTERD